MELNTKNKQMKVITRDLPLTLRKEENQQCIQEIQKAKGEVQSIRKNIDVDKKVHFYNYNKHYV